MEKKIMIVDDAMFMRRLIRKTLEGAGYKNIIEAVDGESALEMFWQEKPDLVILDITMPGKSGLEVLEEIKEKEPQSRIVMCSAVGQEELIMQAIVTGAQDFIVKPFKTDEFIKIINHSLD